MQPTSGAPYPGPQYRGPQQPAPWPEARPPQALLARPARRTPIWPFALVGVALVAAAVVGFVLWRSRDRASSASKRASQASAKTAPTVEFDSAIQNWVTCRRPKCSVKVSGGTATVQAQKGTKVTIDGASLEATGTEASVPLDLIALFRERELPARGTKRVEWSSRLTITFPDGATGATTFPIDATGLANGLKERLLPATKGVAVALPEDGPAPAKPRVVALLSSDVALFGRGVGATSIDLVASYQPKTRTLSCGAYRGSDGHVTTLENSGTDFDVSVFERRTGKKVHTALIQGDIAPCQASQSGHYTGHEPHGKLWAAMAELVK